MGYTSVTHTDKNNLIGGSAAGSMEALLETNARFDFGIKWTGSNGGVSVPSSPTQPSVGLIPGMTFPIAVDFGAMCFKNGSAFTGEIECLGVDWVAGTRTGTVKENYYKAVYSSGVVTSRTLETARDNVDPGFGSIGSGRDGPRYTFMLAGTEFRVYANYKRLGDTPIFVMASPTEGMGFPLSLGMFVPGSFAVTAVTAGNLANLSTVYSLRDQTADFGSAQSNLHLRIYQNSKFPGIDGFPLDINI